MIKQFIAPVIVLSLALSACNRAPARPAIEPTRTLPPPAAATAAPTVMPDAPATSAPPPVAASTSAVAAGRLSLKNAGALDKLYSHGDLLPANLYTVSSGRVGMYNTRAFEVFDAATLKSMRQTPVGTNPAGNTSWYALSPDARTGAIMWLDGRVDVYDLEAGTLRKTLKVDLPSADFASDIAISEDGGELLAISQGILKRIRIADGKQIGDEQRMVSDTAYVIFARDGAQMAVVRAGGAIDVLDTLTGKSVTLKSHVEGLNRLLFSPEGGRLFTSSATTVTVWDTQTGTEMWSIGSLPEAVSVALPPSGDLAVLYSDTGMVLYDTAAGKPVREMGLTSGGPVTSVYFSEDGRTFYAAGSGQLEHFDVASGKRLASVRRFAGTLMRFTPDDRLLTWSDRVQNGELAVLAATDGATVASMQHKAPVRWSVGSAKGTYAATNTRDQTLSVWRTSDGAALFGVAPKARQGMLCFSPDESAFAYFEENAVIVRDLQAKSLRKRFKMPFDEVISLTYCDNAAGLIAFQSERAIEIMGLDGVTVSTIDMAKPVTESLNMEISSDGTRLSAIRDGQVDVWDVRSGETIKSLKTGANTRVVVSADAARIAVVSASEIEVIDLKGGATTKLAIPDTHIVDVLFPADPAILVTTVRIIDPKQPMLRGEPNFVAGAIAVWDSATGKELRRIPLADAVYFAAMSPDGTQLATSAKSGEVSVWGVK